MTPTLKIYQNVVDRLLKVQEKCLGNLYGIFYKNNLLVVGLSINAGHKSEVINTLPTEIDKCGAVAVDTEINDDSRVKQLMEDVDVTDNPIYIACNLNESNKIQAYFLIHDKCEKTTYEVITEQDMYSQFIHVRLKTQLPLICESHPELIKEGIFNIRKQLTSGQTAFNFPETNVYLTSNEAINLTGLSGEATIGEFCDESGINEGSTTNKKKKQSYEMNILRVHMYKKATRDVNIEGVKVHAPVVRVDKRLYESTILKIDIDSLSMIHKETKIIDLYPILVESSCRYLRLLESVLLKRFDEQGDDINFSELQTFHFFPEYCGHFFSLIYPKSDEDEILSKEREHLHKQLLLPLNRPMFRRANRFIFKGDVQGSSPIINPHEGINASGNGGEIVLVRGKYSYYHYCQDSNLDDNGWGCAYRSLQTLASWFVLQGYADQQVPTFKDIQKCLVDIGDKPSNFLGSRQWIGSTEVNFVLNTLLKVTSKILYVSSGEELGSKGPELLNHFQTQGSPIMIGGGVLAHTILGVDYNRQSGDLKFLILDPHFTGSDDLNVIRNKGWCGWKGVDFWDKRAYYNMCLPQVPITI